MSVGFPRIIQIQSIKVFGLIKQLLLKFQSTNITSVSKILCPVSNYEFV